MCQLVLNRDNPELNNKFIGGQNSSTQKGICVSTSNFLVRNVQLIITTALLESLLVKINAFIEKNSISTTKKKDTRDRRKEVAISYSIGSLIVFSSQTNLLASRKT